MVKRLQKLGWQTSAVPAAETGTAVVREGPGHGGVMVATAKHHCQRGLGKDSKEAIQAPGNAGLATQWISRTRRAKGQDVLFCTVYLAPGLGLEGTNLITLQELGTYIRVMGVEFVVGGDWNMLTEEMDILSMDTFLTAQWLAPPGPVPGGHRPIDRFLVSKGLARGSTVQWDHEGPWAAPHSGMVLTLDLEALQQDTRILEAPTAIEVAHGPDLPREHHMQYSEVIRERGREKLAERIAVTQPQFQSDAVDHEYLDFAVAAEHLPLARAPHAKRGKTHRGWPLAAKIAPLRPKKPVGWMAKPSGLSTWAALEARLGNYKAAIRKQQPSLAATHWEQVQNLLDKVQQQPRILQDPELENGTIKCIRAMGEEPAGSQVQEPNL